ncbi:MAG TPA: response regulator transcription factor [Bryobacteraceae bacterium]|nr:response regulator transcription factor [Bryobacteraceae bacterium]
MNPYAPYTVIVADQLTLLTEALACLCSGFTGCTVVGQACDGGAAWDLIESAKPDVALLDLHLSRLMTIEVLRRVENHGLTTRVVVLGDSSEGKSVMSALRAGANGFALKSGSAGQLEEALRHVLQGGVFVTPVVELRNLAAATRRQPGDPLDGLSARENQVFCHLVEGVRAKEIAARLSLSPKTIDTYRASLMRKLNIHDVPSLVKFAIRNHVGQRKISR